MAYLRIISSDKDILDNAHLNQHVSYWQKGYELTGDVANQTLYKWIIVCKADELVAISQLLPNKSIVAVFINTEGNEMFLPIEFAHMNKRDFNEVSNITELKRRLYLKVIQLYVTQAEELKSQGDNGMANILYQDAIDLCQQQFAYYSPLFHPLNSSIMSSEIEDFIDRINHSIDNGNRDEALQELRRLQEYIEGRCYESSSPVQPDTGTDER